MKFNFFKPKQIMDNSNLNFNDQIGNSGNGDSSKTTVASTTGTNPPVKNLTIDIKDVSAMTPPDAFAFLITDLKADGEKYVDVIAHLETALYKYNNLNK